MNVNFVDFDNKDQVRYFNNQLIEEAKNLAGGDVFKTIYYIAFFLHINWSNIQNFGKNKISKKGENDYLDRLTGKFIDKFFVTSYSGKNKMLSIKVLVNNSMDKFSKIKKLNFNNIMDGFQYYGNNFLFDNIYADCSKGKRRYPLKNNKNGLMSFP